MESERPAVVPKSCGASFSWFAKSKQGTRPSVCLYLTDFSLEREGLPPAPSEVPHAADVALVSCWSSISLPDGMPYLRAHRGSSFDSQQAACSGRRRARLFNGLAGNFCSMKILYASVNSQTL